MHITPYKAMYFPNFIFLRKRLKSSHTSLKKLEKEDFNSINRYFISSLVPENGDLVINMEKKEENEQHKGKKYLRREFAYTKYQQTLVLPDDVDKTKIGAEVKHGILNITLPKIAEAEAKVARTIEVQ